MAAAEPAALGFAALAGLAGLAASSFVVGLSGALSPGPLVAMTITHSARRGHWAGPALVAGHAVLEVALLAALMAGLAAWLARPAVAGMIGAVGAFILLWMGVSMARSLPGLKLELEAGAPAGRGPFWDGVLLSLGNPYWILWWATVGMSFAALARDAGYGWWGLLAFFLGHVSSDLAWFWAVAWVVSRGKRFMSDSAYRIISGVCAGFLVLMAGTFFWFAWVKLSA